MCLESASVSYSLECGHREERERECVCVCVCERERERQRDRKRDEERSVCNRVGERGERVMNELTFSSLNFLKSYSANGMLDEKVTRNLFSTVRKSCNFSGQ